MKLTAAIHRVIAVELLGDCARLIRNLEKHGSRLQQEIRIVRSGPETSPGTMLSLLLINQSIKYDRPSYHLGQDRHEFSHILRTDD